MVVNSESYKTSHQEFTLEKVLSCEVYEIFKKTFFYITPPVVASEVRIVLRNDIPTK